MEPSAADTHRPAQVRRLLASSSCSTASSFAYIARKQMHVFAGLPAVDMQRGDILRLFLLRPRSPATTSMSSHIPLQALLVVLPFLLPPHPLPCLHLCLIFFPASCLPAVSRRCSAHPTQMTRWPMPWPSTGKTTRLRPWLPPGSGRVFTHRGKPALQPAAFGLELNEAYLTPRAV